MKFITDENNEGERIDSYLSNILKDISRSKLQKYIKDGSITVNDSVIKPSYTLKISDIINISDKDLIDNKQKIIIKAENIPLEVVWENENMAVINKPSGMLTHPTGLETEHTIVNALLFKYGENLSDLNGDLRRGIIHRLDRNTSGLIMIAKNNKTHEYLVNQMKERAFVKKYIAVTKGVIQQDEFEINTPIGRHPSQPHKMAVNGKDAKDALSKIKVIKRFDDATLTEITLITGRTHQIRVHLSSIGHPVYNDTLYGFGKMKIKTEEQVLQAYKLEFTKPFSTECISLEIPYSDKVTKVLNFLEINSKN